jgi:hypothetical protein
MQRCGTQIEVQVQSEEPNNSYIHCHQNPLEYTECSETYLHIHLQCSQLWELISDV